MNSHHSLWLTFRWPLLFGVLSLTGLVGALLEDGLWDRLGAALIAASVVAVVWARLRARSPSNLRHRSLEDPFKGVAKDPDGRDGAD